MPKFIDLTDQKFGRWTVLERSKSDKRWQSLWKCKCQCGTIKIVYGIHLRRGNSKSCGCIVSENNIKRCTTHGKTNTPEFKIWQGLFKRCNNKNAPQYKNYGGRGIKICERWLKFESFFEDMGKRPKGLTIERINNDKGYYKENCKWATLIEQARNRRVQSGKKIKEVGVYLVRNKYKAIITANGEDIQLGYFNDLESAVLARRKAKIKYWGKRYD